MENSKPRLVLPPIAPFAPNVRRVPMDTLRSLLAMSRTQAARDGLWIFSGHLVASFVILVGMRLLTELAEPHLFGAYTLLNGMLALASGVLFQPLSQAAMRHYGDFATLQSVAALKRYFLHANMRRGLWTALVLALAGALDQLLFGYLSMRLWCILGLTVILDAWKFVEIVMRNASRDNRGYATLFAMDLTGRMIGSVGLAWTLGVSVETLLLGQFFGGLVSLVGFVLLSRRKIGLDIQPTDHHRQVDQLTISMRHFAAPLVWTPVIGWVNGLSDRYILAALTDLSATGTYAAAYGLASRPLLMIGTVTEAALRQILYAAVAAKDTARARRVMLWWVGSNVTFGLMTATMLFLAATMLVTLLLAEEYRETATLILPWLLFGHIPLLAAQPLQVLAYANHRTREITMVQAVCAVMAVGLAAIGAWWNGILGVAIAVPIYFSAQFLLTALVAAQQSRARA